MNSKSKESDRTSFQAVWPGPWSLLVGKGRCVIQPNAYKLAQVSMGFWNNRSFRAVEICYPWTAPWWCLLKCSDSHDIHIQCLLDGFISQFSSAIQGVASLSYVLMLQRRRNPWFWFLFAMVLRAACKFFAWLQLPRNFDFQAQN